MLDIFFSQSKAPLTLNLPHIRAYCLHEKTAVSARRMSDRFGQIERVEIAPAVDKLASKWSPSLITSQIHIIFSGLSTIL